jgi:hypothetical protein
MVNAETYEATGSAKKWKSSLLPCFIDVDENRQ